MVYASSSSTVSVTKLAIGSWGTTPTRSARSRGRLVEVLRPSMRTSPVSTPPVKWGTSPLIAPSKVLFPEPVPPTTRMNSPSATVRFTLSTTQGASGLYRMETLSNSIMTRPALAGRPWPGRDRSRVRPMAVGESGTPEPVPPTGR